MNLNNFTNKAQEAILASQRLAQELNHTEIEPTHVLMALMQQSDGFVPQVIAKICTRPQTLIAELQQQLDSKPKVQGTNVHTTLSRAPSHVLTPPDPEPKQNKLE